MATAPSIFPVDFALSGHIKHNRSLLPICCTTINLRPPFPIPAGRIKGYRRGQLTFTIFLEHHHISRIAPARSYVPMAARPHGSTVKGVIYIHKESALKTLPSLAPALEHKKTPRRKSVKLLAFPRGGLWFTKLPRGSIRCHTTQ